MVASLRSVLDFLGPENLHDEDGVTGPHLITHDAGMALRAQRTGLETKRLTDPVERDPDPNKTPEPKRSNRHRPAPRS
ncbi:hypothetical protein UO65_4851 [Actinokineospora spheciospongiae]|uniref:Uncharacterized protein n=1 Tax=Actinokineospora spheciospongiae TaxID=909613 RepID=W7IHN9_9PSEU|nr:hypothetical protein [Actinokineospora spheciospongiae]EWC59848.1 hypothetical protein UO65_4851 [Actinokineospora spheciospongiae]